MPRLYDRAFSLTLEGGSNAPDFSKLRVRFIARQTVGSTPNIAVISIYNVSQETANRFTTDKEFKKVTLEAGYRDIKGVIFKGEIQKCIYGPESPIETRLDIYAQDGYQAISYAKVNTALAAGYTSRDVLNACHKAMSPFGISLGFVADGLTRTKASRGIVLSDYATAILRTLENKHGARWSVTGGKLNLVSNSKGMPSQNGPYVLNSETGMISRPWQDFDGIHVKTLLIPTIQYESVIKIDQKSVTQSAPDQSIRAEAVNQMLPTIAADGLYRVLYVERRGDTHSNEWYNDLTCLSLTNKQADGTPGFVPQSLVPYLAPGLPTEN